MKNCLYVLFVLLLLACADEPEQGTNSVENTSTALEAHPHVEERTKSVETAVSDEMTQEEVLRVLKEMQHLKEAGEDLSGTVETAAAGGAPSDYYQVRLSADEIMKKPGPANQAIVWIGDPDFIPELSEGSVADEALIPALGESAIVTLNAPEFDIDPAGSDCVRIHPTGSEVLFNLLAKRAGNHRISARVDLFDNNQCDGIPIPKLSPVLHVEVKVSGSGFLFERGNELWNIFWEQLLDFWGAVVALFFALLMFLLRKRLKNWFGFSAE